MASHMKSGSVSFDKGRRTFRGRSGPTDRNLPKRQARRRHVNKQIDSDSDGIRPNKCDDEKSGRISQVQDVEVLAEVEIELLDKAENVLQVVQEEVEECGKDLKGGEVSSPAAIEVKHLSRRIKNVRESIQLSSSALAQNTISWHENCLNAVQNCVNEWRSIVGFHHDFITQEEIQVKQLSLQLFQLIQMALQCGPLQGAKPGYFKRCGGETARMALTFIESLSPLQKLHFSERQELAIETWRANAIKAAEKDDPPSKFVLKKQKGKKGR